MITYRDRPWDSRVGQLGDMAEQIFEEVCPTNYLRTGMNRPPISMTKLPPVVRFIPDYLVHDSWVEVMGFGRDQTLKCKVIKWDALARYNEDFPVALFLWDSHNQTYSQYSYWDLGEHIDGSGYFPEGHQYYSWDIGMLRQELPDIDWKEVS